MIVPLISYEHLKNYITANLKHFFFYQSDAMNSILGQNVHWGLLKLGHASPFKGLLGQYKTQTEFVTELLNVLQQVRVPNRIRKYILRVIMTLIRVWTTNWSNYSLLYRAVFGRSVNPGKFLQIGLSTVSKYVSKLGVCYMNLPLVSNWKIIGRNFSPSFFNAQTTFNRICREKK